MQQLIEALCNERGISGDEGRVRARIQKELEGYCEMHTDPLGNLIAVKAGRAPKQKIALFAHMDEVGLLVTHITEQGLLRFEAIGIDPRVLHGRRVRVGDAALPGAIGAKAWHHLDKDAREAELKADSLCIDIGAASYEEAATLVQPGDAVTLDAPFCVFGGQKQMLCARALDDRLGCALLIELLRSDCPYELTGVFTCGEESSMFGATAAAFAVGPQLAVVLETTTAGDVDGASPEKTVCSLGQGPVISFADKGTLYDRGLYALGFAVAEKNGIAVQTKHGVYGGNESRVVSRSRAGVRTMAVSVPCRYLHSASCVADYADVVAVQKLLPPLIEALAAL